LFILYTEHYDKFCKDILGGWMDIYESDDGIQEYESY